MITAYRPDEEGRLIPEIPGDGPCRGWDERPCRLSSDHDRERKTGPCFPLRVMRCRVHGHGFTLYPTGHFPYGRKRLEAAACDGSPERRERRGETRRGDGGEEAAWERFRGTYFEAVVDAARGRAWPRTGYEGSLRERIAFILGVPGQTLEDAVRGLDGPGGYRRLGRAGVQVLAVLPREGSLWQRLSESGALLGEWPAPRLCPGRGRTLRHTPFRMPGTRPPPEAS